MQQLTTLRDGIARCAKYAFGPNKLHLCGPDANRELFSYLEEGITDAGLAGMLQKFQTLYPYLQEIAQANGIRDPFDDRVVHAYWIGNELLEGVSTKTFFRHLIDNLGLRKHTTSKSFDQLTEKLPKGARMHHSFHVFNVYKRTGNMKQLHTIESMDACRVSWGRITAADGPSITVLRKPLRLISHSLQLGNEESYTIHRRLEEDASLDELKPGDIISMHWYQPCEVITERDVHWLEWYTNKHLALANLTL